MKEKEKTIYCCPKCGIEFDINIIICPRCIRYLRAKSRIVSKKKEEDKAQCISSLVSEPLMAFKKDSESIFLPLDQFYTNWDDTYERLFQMAGDILVWLKMDITDVYCGYSDDMNAPGIYSEQGGRKTILINSKYKNNPFQVGAILAHECMHHYMRMHNLESSYDLKNERETDLMTVSNGLGILVINGMAYKGSSGLTILAALFGFLFIREEKTSFGYFEYSDYCKYLRSYLEAKGIDEKDIIGFVRPEARVLFEERKRQNLIVIFILIVIAVVLVSYLGLAIVARCATLSDFVVTGISILIIAVLLIRHKKNKRRRTLREK